MFRPSTIAPISTVLALDLPSTLIPLSVFFSLPVVPKDPSVLKCYDDSKNIVNYYAVVFLLRPPNLLRRRPFSFFERKNVCNSQENGVRRRRAAIVNHPGVLKILRVVNLPCVVFLVRRGPLGKVGKGQKSRETAFSWSSPRFLGNKNMERGITARLASQASVY